MGSAVPERGGAEALLHGDMGARKTRLKIHMKLSFCIQTPRVNERILPRSNTIFKVIPPRATSGRWGSAMQDSQRYRHNAAQCLLAAKEAFQPCYRKLRLSMASSWLSLARQDEAMDNLLASSNASDPVKPDKPAA
jgi:hypothetical protein